MLPFTFAENKHQLNIRHDSVANEAPPNPQVPNETTYQMMTWLSREVSINRSMGFRSNGRGRR